MKTKRQGKLRSASRGAKRRPLLSRKARLRKGPSRKTRRSLLRKGGKNPLLLRKKRRLRRRLIRRRRAVHPPVQVTPAIETPLSPQVVPLPPDLGVPPELPPGDAYQQGYTEAYNVGFDAGFAKGFEDGHKLELG
ncbi:hypothetical protein [Paenibacillus piscarius]|uniref:hypothetical protein n=1 Tax=Paenibacillus piscarius TaxID=1089681 RepID=UPI001EE8CFDF|nr:hypothetical protein [Paenibacillus piscarius]